MPTFTATHPATQRQTAFGLMALAIGIGSFSFTLVKVALRELSPAGLACGRVVSSAVVFAIVVAPPHRRRPVLPEHRARVLLCGFGGSAVFHLLFAWGQQRVSVAIAAITMATFPVIVAAGEVVFLQHRLQPRQVAGLVLTTAGCGAIGLAGGSSPGGSMWGAAAIAAATLVWAGVTVATRSIVTVYDPWWLNAPGTFLGAALMLVVEAPHVGEFGSLSLEGWLAVVWLGSASSAFVYYVMARLMTVVSATAASSMGTVVTPTSVFVAWVVLGDRPTLLEAVGGVIVIAGVVLVTRRERASSGAASARERDLQAG
ncbi:MAG: DMT family transporter [Ilumatobacteraceae bacterium]